MAKMLASDDPIYVDAHARFEASAGDSENMAIWKQNGPITIRTKKEADGTTTAIGEHARMGKACMLCSAGDHRHIHHQLGALDAG